MLSPCRQRSFGLGCLGFVLWLVSGSISPALANSCTGNEEYAPVDDHFEVSENGSIPGNVLRNDHVFCMSMPPVSTVNGEPVIAGKVKQLPSGASLDIKRDGTFVYYPNGAFSHLGAGAQAGDSFVYGAYGEDEGLVSIKIFGATTSDPSLLALGSFTIQEYAPNGTLAGVMAIEDTPQSDVTYSLTSDADGLFWIDAKGHVSVSQGRRVDFERATTHPIGVHAVHSSGTTFDAPLSIRVLDINPERIVGTNASEIMYGGDADDTFYGEGGSDLLRGGGGKDTLYGGTGPDKFILAQPTDSLWGAKRDVIGNWEPIDKIGVALIDANTSRAGNQDFTFIGLGTPDLEVGQGRIKYYRESNRTYVIGNTSADSKADFRIEIVGLHKITPDNFVGVSNAILFGSPRGDTLTGTDGDDVFFGGPGKDSLFGLAGSDTFVLREAFESRVGPERDIIEDWNDSDVIGLALLDAKASVSGKQHFDFAGLGGSTPNAAEGVIRYSHYNGNTFVMGGVDADDLAEFQIQIRGVHTLGPANFKGLN